MEIPKTWYSHEWESSKKDWRKRISILSECVNFDRFRRNQIIFLVLNLH